jgi:hypothetical protein
MKPLTPHDPRNDTFDELIAAALHGELTPEERTQFESHLQTDPAAQAAYQEAQAMHDLLEKTHKSAQPDSAFEQRMVSGVRRKLQTEQHRETAWESLLALWTGVRRVLSFRYLWAYGGVCGLVMVLALGFVIYSGNQVKGVFTTISDKLAVASSSGYATPSDIIDSSKPLGHQQRDDLKKVIDAQGINYRETPQEGITMSGYVDSSYTQQFAGNLKTHSDTVTFNGATDEPQNFNVQAIKHALKAGEQNQFTQSRTDLDDLSVLRAKSLTSKLEAPTAAPPDAPASPSTTPTATDTASTQVAAPDTRKLIRNAQLDLQVKSFQAAMDQITALTKSAGGYVDTSNSQKGGNGKLQGTVVVKVLPQNLDDFLLKLRDLGEVQNQSVSTDDVTKDYYDTQARLDNSRRMEEQLQDLLKHANSKVSDLLAVERELGRVRGEIEQMQGQLKLYDFQVQYATVTINMSEKDINQAAAYLLKEQDDFSLFATDVEGTFQKARQAADDFKAQVLTANLNHNSGSDVSAELMVMVAPDQIEPFLAQVRGLGRVANFTRQTQRVAKDGGDSSQPADETKTEKDKVQVHLAIRSDDETRKQVALTVVTKAVDDALDQAKAAALANAGVEILNSSLNKTPQGQSTAQLTVRVPGKDYAALLAASFLICWA